MCIACQLPKAWGTWSLDFSPNAIKVLTNQFLKIYSFSIRYQKPLLQLSSPISYPKYQTPVSACVCKLYVLPKLEARRVRVKYCHTTITHALYIRRSKVHKLNIPSQQLLMLQQIYDNNVLCSGCNQHRNLSDQVQATPVSIKICDINVLYHGVIRSKQSQTNVVVKFNACNRSYLSFIQLKNLKCYYK